MYDTLTEDELSHLAGKLSRAGNAFYENAMAISRTVNHLRETGRVQVLSPEWNGLWDVRKPVVAAMDEMHALMNEVDDEARARRAAQVFTDHWAACDWCREGLPCAEGDPLHEAMHQVVSDA